MRRKEKIIIFDIEVLSSMNADCGSVCSMAYKELGSKKIHVMSIADYPKTYSKNVFDDSKLVKDIAKVLVEADILIGHNSKSTAKWGFDMKYINHRLIMNGYKPILKHIGEVDTYHDMSKKHLKFRSNKLGELGKALGVGSHKGEMDFPRDWNKVIVKHPGAMAKMLKYNKLDVALTEKVYNKLKHICTNHPNIGIAQGKRRDSWPCPLCGSTDKVNNKDKRYLTTRASYERLVCRRCNFIFKGPLIKDIPLDG